ncbi:MAG TPA: sulfur transferase domain-containing protein [Gemmatimonadales bacterium]|nr:sulfur transferase domain-containing protein [Gemmatimonadales bacterium]
MSDLLRAAAGIPNACEPLPGLLTGGQPTAEHIAALARAGCEVVLDIRDPMEPRGLDEADLVRAAGMEYLNLPVTGAHLTDATLARVRDTVANLVGDRKALFHCGSGNRVGATLIPYLVLDRGMAAEDAVAQAIRIGTRRAELIEWALDYVNRQQGAGTP